MFDKAKRLKLGNDTTVNEMIEVEEGLTRDALQSSLHGKRIEVKPVIISVGFLVKVTDPKTGEEGEMFMDRKTGTVTSNELEKEFEL